MKANSTGVLSYPVDTAIGKYLRVKLSAGYLVAAGIEEDLGTVHSTFQMTGLGAVTVAAVVSPNAQGSRYMIASGAITKYAPVFADAAGKITATPNGQFRGYALTAATADGDIVEVDPRPSTARYSTVEAKTADFTITAAESGKTFTSVGAAGTITGALPAATVGLKYRFRVGAAQQLRIDPNGTEVIALPSTGVAGAAGKYLVADADGETVDLECTKAGQWSVFGFTGTWTAEP